MDDFEELNRYQDILGQLPMLQGYTHLLYTFSTPDGVSQNEVCAKLERAIVEIREQVPWMGGRVINYGKTNKCSGTYRVVSCPPPKRSIEVRDLSREAASYADIKARKAPMSMLNSTLLTPVSSFPTRFEDSDQDPAQVLRVQASIIKGGMIIDFAIHHNMADGTGLYGLVRLVAAKMRGESVSRAILREANRDRRGLIPLLGPHEPLLDHGHHKRPPVTTKAPLITSPEPAAYHIFRITTRNIQKLKDLASDGGRDKMEPNCLPSDNFSPAAPTPSFVSSDDAISAFIWQRYAGVALARCPGRQTKEDEARPSRFSRAVDGRRAAGLTREYLGVTVHNATSWLTLGELVRAPLAHGKHPLKPLKLLPPKGPRWW